MSAPRFTPETRALATRLEAEVTAFGCAVQRSATGERLPKHGGTARVRVGLPMGRAQGDTVLRALEVPITARVADVARLHALVEHLRTRGFVVRHDAPSVIRSVSLFVTSSELQARASELELLERASVRAGRVLQGVVETFAVIAEAEAAEERDALAREGIRLHALTLPALARYLRDGQREVRVAALAAMGVLRPLLAGVPEPSWAQTVSGALRLPPVDLVQDVHAVVYAGYEGMEDLLEAEERSSAGLVALRAWEFHRAQGAPERAKPSTGELRGLDDAEGLVRQALTRLLPGTAAGVRTDPSGARPGATVPPAARRPAPSGRRARRRPSRCRPSSSAWGTRRRR